MNRMTRLILGVGMALCIAGNTGCMFAAKRMFKEAKGASSKARTFPDSPRETYASYKGVTIGNPDSDVSPFVSKEFTAALRTELGKQLSTEKEAPFPGGEPTFMISPKVLWYYEAGGAGGILGSDSFTVVLYTLSVGGKQLDHIQVVTKSAASRTGDDDMAKSSVGAMVKWFESRKEGKFSDVEDEEKKQKKEEKEERKEKKEADEKDQKEERKNRD